MISRRADRLEATRATSADLKIVLTKFGLELEFSAKDDRPIGDPGFWINRGDVGRFCGSVLALIAYVRGGGRRGYARIVDHCAVVSVRRWSAQQRDRDPQRPVGVAAVEALCLIFARTDGGGKSKGICYGVFFKSHLSYFRGPTHRTGACSFKCQVGR